MNEEEWLEAIDSAVDPQKTARDACEDCPSVKVWCRRLELEPVLEVAQEGLEATRGWIDQAYAYTTKVLDLLGADFREEAIHLGTSRYEKLLQPRREWEAEVARNPAQLFPYLRWELARYQPKARLDFCQPLFERLLTRDKRSPGLWLEYIRHEWVDQLSLTAAHLPQPPEGAQRGLRIAKRALRRFPDDARIITAHIRLLQAARQSQELIQYLELVANLPESTCLQLFSSISFFARTGAIDSEPVIELLVESIGRVKDKIVVIDLLRGLDSEKAARKFRQVTAQQPLPDHAWIEFINPPPEDTSLVYQRYRSHAGRIIERVERTARRFYLMEGWAAALEKQQPILDSLTEEKSGQSHLRAGSKPSKWSLLISGIPLEVLSPLKPVRTYGDVQVLEFDTPLHKENARERLAAHGQVWDAAGTIAKCSERPIRALGVFRVGQELYAQFRDAAQTSGGPTVWPRGYEVSIHNFKQDPSQLSQWCPQLVNYISKQNGRSIYAVFPSLASATEAVDILRGKSHQARLMIARDRAIVVTGPEFHYEDATRWGPVETYEIVGSSWIVIYGTQPVAARAVLGINGWKGLHAKNF